MWPFSGRIKLPIPATINRILACSGGWNPRDARNLEIEQRQYPCWSVEAELRWLLGSEPVIERHTRTQRPRRPLRNTVFLASVAASAFDRELRCLKGPGASQGLARRVRADL